MAPFLLSEFISSQYRALPKVDKTDLSGRVVIVTGANVGLGLEAARHFAAMKPAKLIIAVRTISKGQQAKEDIVNSLYKSHGDVSKLIEVWELDLSSFDNVKSFAKRVQGLDRLDIALLNAGISYDTWSQTNDGYEAVLQTNVIATGLLALLLYPLVRRSADLPVPSGSSALKPHITLTGSGVHFWAKFPEANDEHPILALNDKSRFFSDDRYNTSKLLDLFLVREMAKRFDNSKVVVNVVDPGLCHSNLANNVSMGRYLFVRFLKLLLARTTEAGSRTLVWASLNSTKAGAYSSSCKQSEESDYSLSEKGQLAQVKVWSDLKNIWDRIAPETASLTA